MITNHDKFYKSGILSDFHGGSHFLLTAICNFIGQTENVCLLADIFVPAIWCGILLMRDCKVTNTNILF